MAGSSVVFEPHDGAGAASFGSGGADGVFFVAVILCLSVLSVIILAAAGDSGGTGTQGKLRRRKRANGPVFVGGKGCGCGGCRAGHGVCGTYLS